LLKDGLDEVREISFWVVPSAKWSEPRGVGPSRIGNQRRDVSSYCRRLSRGRMRARESEAWQIAAWRTALPMLPYDASKKGGNKKGFSDPSKRRGKVRS